MRFQTWTLSSLLDSPSHLLREAPHLGGPLVRSRQSSTPGPFFTVKWWCPDPAALVTRRSSVVPCDA